LKISTIILEIERKNGKFFLLSGLTEIARI